MRIGDSGNVVRVAGDSTHVVLAISGLAAVDKMTPTDLAAFAGTLRISDTVRLGQPATHTATIAQQEFLGLGGGSLSWLVRVTTAGLPPNVTERRLTKVSIGPKSPNVFPLEFVLTNQSAAQFEVTAPGHDWMVSRSDPDPERTYPLLVVNRSEPIFDLRLAQVSMKRSDDGGNIGFDEVELVNSVNAATVADPAKKTPINFAPNEARTVFLRLGQSNRLLPYGSFSGQVQLVTNGTAPKGVPLTARVSASGVRRAGAGLVLLGLLTSLYITARLRPRLARLQALRPATLLRDSILRFAVESGQLAPGEVGGILAEAEKQAGRLETTALDEAGLLPLNISVAGGVTGDAATGLKTRLDDVSGRLAGLLVLRDTIVKLVTANPKSARRIPVQTAIDQLNDAAGTATTATVAETTAKGILDEMRAELAKLPGTESILTPVPARITTQQLDFLIHQTASVAAFIWAAVSFAIGVTYIYSDVDFGTPVDLLGMFLWGLGLTTFGAGIQQLTPQQVATRVGVAMPRSTAAEGAQS